MARLSPVALAVGLLASAASAEVVIERFTEPILHLDVGREANDEGSGLAAARFLRFAGPDDGSRLSFLVNGPRGGSPAEPSVIGTVYSEAGEFINSFVIRTDEWFFEVDALSLVLDTNFGTMELLIDAIASPDGSVTVEHSAFGKFSVGIPGVCKDVL